MEKKQLKYPTDEINRRLDLAQSAEQKASDLSRLTDSIQQEQNAIKQGLQEASSEEALNARMVVVEKKTEDLQVSADKASWYVTDAQGNVMLKVDAEGLDAAKLGENITSLIKELYGNITIDDILDADSINPVQNKVIVEALTNLNVGSIEGIRTDLYPNCLYVVDAQGRIGWYIDRQGKTHSLNDDSDISSSTESRWKGKKLCVLGDSLGANGVWEKVLVDRLGIVFDNVENSTTNNPFNYALAAGGRGFRGVSAIKSAFLLEKFNPDIAIIVSNAAYHFDTSIPAYHMSQYIEDRNKGLAELLSSVSVSNRKAGTIVQANTADAYVLKENAAIADWEDTNSWVSLSSLQPEAILRGVIETILSRNPSMHLFWLIPSYTLPSYDSCPSIYDSVGFVNRNKAMEYLGGKATEYGVSEVPNYVASYDYYVSICRDYGIPLLDMRYESGITLHNVKEFYGENPNIHPTTSGYERWGETIVKLIK